MCNMQVTSESEVRVKWEALVSWTWIIRTRTNVMRGKVKARRSTWTDSYQTNGTHLYQCKLTATAAETETAPGAVERTAKAAEIIRWSFIMFVISFDLMMKLWQDHMRQPLMKWFMLVFLAETVHTCVGSHLCRLTIVFFSFPLLSMVGRVSYRHKINPCGELIKIFTPGSAALYLRLYLVLT